jgi:hypothetical protein
MELLGVECGRYRGRKTTPTERRVSKDGSGGSRLSTLQFWDGSVSPQRRGARCHLYVNAVLRARVTTVGKFSRGCATAVCPRLAGSARRKNLLTYPILVTAIHVSVTVSDRLLCPESSPRSRKDGEGPRLLIFRIVLVDVNAEEPV